MSNVPALRSKVILVTGASSGIGRAVALDLAADAPQLVICGRRGDRLDTLARTIREQHPHTSTLATPCDLRDPAAIAQMFQQIRDQLGGVDILINNAGLGRHAPLTQGAIEDWQEMLDVNVLALCICTKEAVGDMRRRGDAGHVLHISSMAGHRIPEEGGVYAATKFAVRALTEGLRRELHAKASEIRVTAISPGFVETEFAQVFAHDDRGAAERTYGRYPVLRPEDIAACVRFAVTAPKHMQVHDLLVRPTAQPL